MGLFRRMATSKAYIAKCAIRKICNLSASGDIRGTNSVQVVNQNPAEDCIDFVLVGTGAKLMSSTLRCLDFASTATAGNAAATTRTGVLQSRDFQQDILNNLRTVEQIANNVRAPPGSVERAELDRSWDAWKKTVSEAVVTMLSGPAKGSFVCGQEWILESSVFRLRWGALDQGKERLAQAVVDDFFAQGNV